VIDVPARLGAWGVLWWLVVRQRGRVAAGSVYGTLSMTSMVATPYLLGRAVDDGPPAAGPHSPAGRVRCSLPGSRAPP
jgi:hypothetical protein